MKRHPALKRRDRKSSDAPYTKYGKVPHKYSGAYYEWEARVVGRRTRPDAA